MDREIYTATLTGNINLSRNAIKIFKKIESQEIIFPDEVWKSRSIQIILEYAAVKIHSLFDTTKGVISFDKVTKDLRKSVSLEQIQSFENDYQAIKNKYSKLIKIIEHNRHIGIAHTQKENKLGWGEETIKKLIETWPSSGFEKIKPVSEEYIFLTHNNFSTEEALEMLQELENSIFYNFWYPRLINKK